MILGVGIDVIEVTRVKASWERFGDRFLQRLFRPEEVAYCMTHKFPALPLAARFAAKEAISKAFGTGIGALLGWQDVEVGRKPSGEPFVVLRERGRKLLEQRGGNQVHLSLTHTAHYAAAIAILARD